MKTTRKAIAIFLVVLTLFTTCSVSMPVFAAYENVTDGNVVSGKVTDGNVPSEELQKDDEATILSEITEKRSETEKHFLMSDGTFMVAKYSQPVHYQSNDGEWVEYDNTLSEAEATTEQTALFGTDEIYSTKNQIENVVFAKKSNSNTLVSYEAKDYPISFNYQSAKKSNIKLTEKNEELEGNDTFLTLPNLTQEVLYENVFTKVDLQYFVSTNELKENIILKAKNAQNTFTVNYDIGALTAEIVDSQTINLMSGSEHIYTISAPCMYDAGGEKSEKVTLAVKKNKNGKLTVEIAADSEWLHAESRAFPVTIDPSITTETARSDIDSVMIAQACGNTNYSNQAEMIVGREPSEYGYCRVLTKFVLPELNKGDVVVDAELNFLNHGLWPYSDSTPNMQVNAHKITSAWNVSTVTWNNKPSNATVAADYDVFEDITEATWRKFNITRMVKAWYENPAENFGVMLKGDNTTGTYAENGVKAYMYTERYNQIEDAYPQIIITYRNNKGLEDYWTYTSLSAGTAGSAYINDYTGNLVFASNAVSTSNELMPLSIDCIYNGYASERAGNVVGRSNSNLTWLGRGWRFSIQQTLISSGSYGFTGDKKTNYPYIYTDGDGTEHYIYRNAEDEDNIVYEDEDGLGLTLTFDTENTAPQWFLLTDKKDNTLKFNVNGNLIESKDANGNKITITYNGRRINKVTDGSGKEYTFVYETNSSGAVTNYVDCILHPSGEKTDFTRNFVDSAGNLTGITHTDGTVSAFTYESGADKAMLTVNDSENYKLTFSYGAKSSGKYVASVTEHGGSTQGQKITFNRSKHNTTKIQTAGTDGVFGNNNDLITTYQFDNFGKTISQQLSTKGGTSSVAGSYEYTEKEASSLASANKVTSAAGLGKNVVNYVSGSNAENLTGWTQYRSNATATIAASTDTAYIGQKSILVNTTAISATNGTANVRQDISGLVEGKDYTLSAYVKTTGMTDVYTNGKTGAYLGVRTIDADGNSKVTYSEFIATNNSAEINGGWRRLTVTVKLPTGCTGVQFYMGVMNSVGKAYFDCVQLEEGTVANDHNLLENSGFENATNGLPDKWTVYNVTYQSSGTTVQQGVTTGYKKEGSKGFIFTGEGQKKKYIFQSIAVSPKPNDTYILSGWAIAYAAKKVSQHPNAKFDINIRVHYDNGNGGTYSEYKDPLEFNPDVNGQWQYAAKAFTLKSKTYPNYKPKSVDIVVIYNYQINYACFDNLQLIKDVAQSYVYDDKGNIISVSANAEQKDSLVYDSKEDLKEYTDALGNKTTYTFNAKHNLTSAKSPGNVLTNYTYNAAGNQTSSTLTNSSESMAIKTETWYTGSAEQNQVKVNAGSYVAGTSDEHGNKTVYYYNVVKDLVKKFRNVLNVYTEYLYDDNTEQLKTVKTYKQDENGNNVELSSPVNYTYSGSKLSTISYGTDTYSFTYDSFGNVVSTNVGGKALSTNTYGANNGVLQSTAYGNGAVKNYTYDSFGNLASVGNGSSTQFTWTYDSAMNPMTHVDNVNNLRYNYEYDGIGRLIRQELRTADNATHLGATEFTYDLRNNVTKVTNEIGGRTLSQSYSYSKIDAVANSERYAKDNLPVRYELSPSRYVDYSYDGLNRLNKKTLSTGTPLVWRYIFNFSGRNAENEDVYRTTQILSEASGKIAYNYTYDVAGNITSVRKADSDGSGNASTAWTAYRTYTYDDLSQLTSETNATTGKTYTYTYDNVGNITSKSDGTDTITYTYGTDSDAGWSKLLTSYNGESIDYDAIGNPTTYRGANLTWTGRQLNSYNKDGTSINYTYDADGLRASKTVNGTKTTYQYLDGKLYYQETNGNDTYFYYDSYGNITAISYYSASTNALQYVFVGTNSLGDVNALYNVNGDLIVRYEYDAWGKVIAETDANGNALTGTAKTWSERNPFRYRGYVYDNETGLYYLQSRYYDPEVGRFVNSDGYVSTGQGALGHNMFAYCGNNPVNCIDATGMFWKELGEAFSNGWNMLKTWAKNTFGAGASITGTYHSNGEEILPEPLPITMKIEERSSISMVKGDITKPISLYSNCNVSSENVSAKVGLKFNFENTIVDVSYGAKGLEISRTRLNGNQESSFGITFDNSALRIEIESSTAIVWDGKTTGTYTTIGASMFIFAPAFVKVPVVQYSWVPVPCKS